MGDTMSIIAYRLLWLFKKPRLEKLEYELELDGYANRFVWSQREENYLEELVRESGIDRLVQGCSNDYEKLLRVAHWVNGLWKHTSSSMPSKSDPITIIREAREGRRFRCVEYAVALAGCMSALGIPSRVVALKRKDVERQRLGAAHVVSECYIEEYDKWVFVDPQWNIVPRVNGVPANAIELQKALYENENIGLDSLEKTKKHSIYPGWIGEYLYFFDTRLDNSYGEIAGRQRIMLVPKGVTAPKVFQRKYPVGDMLFTSSIGTFYPPLTRRRKSAEA